MERILNLTILAEEDGKSVHDLLRGKLGLSRQLLIKLKNRDRGIMLNGVRVFSTARLRGGDHLSLLIEQGDEHSESIIATPGEIDIVYEDEDILILNKPPNQPVHPSKGHIDDSLANIVVWHYQNKGEKITYRCVNRLDNGTSGLMAIAKNAYAHARLMGELHTGTFRRVYLAIACGRIEADEGTIDLPIGRKPDTATIKREIRDDGDWAVTHFTVVDRFGDYTLLRLRLETGRTHQIRVHMAHLGHPLVGDFLYGEENLQLIGRHALHSHKIELNQPVTGEPLEFSSPMPEDMLRLLTEAGH